MTAFGNVILNNALETLNLIELSDAEIIEFKKSCESKWNRLHMIRTVFVVVSFVIPLWGAFTPIKSIQSSMRLF